MFALIEPTRRVDPLPPVIYTGSGAKPPTIYSLSFFINSATCGDKAGVLFLGDTGKTSCLTLTVVWVILTMRDWKAAGNGRGCLY